MYYSDETIEEVRSRSDIVDIISGYVSLKHKGTSYSCCCPFHHEKTPSFHVNRDKQMYHCFGCGAGGNVFTFVMEYENMSFPEAIKYLADKANMSLPEVNMTDRDKRKEAYKIVLKDMNMAAAAYFHYIMKHSDHGKKAYDYFKNRGLLDETIDKFGLGYSDIYRDDLYKYLKNKGYKDEQLKNSGLVEINEKYGGQDKFWNRAMIPILDINGKVIAFGGRVMGEDEPKYINTKDTEVFDKSRTLFAMNIAKKSKRRGIICCEGYMDVISMHQAGFDNAVASLGTAFTFGHATIIKRYAQEVYLAYDSDAAGVNATIKNITILREVGLPVRVINMRPHKDPDEFINAEGTEAFEERINSAESAMMFEARILSEKYNQKDPEERTNFQKEVARQLATIEETLERNNYIDAIANKYMIQKDGLVEMVKKYAVTGMTKSDALIKEEARVENESRGKKGKDTDLPAKLLLSWFVNEPELFETLDGIIQAEDFDQDIYVSVANKLFQQYKKNGTTNPATIINDFENLEEQRLVAEMMQTNMRFEMTHEEAENVITDIVKKIKLASIQKELATTKDIEKIQKLAIDKAKISKLHISLKKR